MGKFRHGPVHHKKKQWKYKDVNLKKSQKQIDENRAVLARVAAASDDRS